MQNQTLTQEVLFELEQCDKTGLSHGAVDRIMGTSTPYDLTRPDTNKPQVVGNFGFGDLTDIGQPLPEKINTWGAQ